MTTDVSSVTETEDTLWLPSAVELFGKPGIESESEGLISWQPDQVAVYEKEGDWYQYQITWPSEGANANAAAMWTRSCDAAHSGAFITYDGSDLDSGNGNATTAVFPGFCL